MTDDLLEQAVGEAIANIVGEQGHGLVMKWFAVIDTVDGSGERWLWSVGSDDLAPWDRLGMLQSAAYADDEP